MPSECEGRLALVTGASRGIGAAIAQRLAAEGAAVAVVARTAEPGEAGLPGSLTETVEAITTVGGTAVPVVADLADPELDHAGLVARAEAELGGPVDILVNNAAALARGPFDQISEKRFRISVQVNVRTPWLLMAAVAPSMRERGEGWILNISSGESRHRVGPPFPATLFDGSCAYGGTKAMLERLTTGAAAELHPSGVAVNSLAPEAAVATPGAAQVELPPEKIEPMETMVEAAVALCTADPEVLTARVAYSLSLLVELGRPVRTLDGRRLVDGWQPDQIDRARLRGA